MIGIIYKIVCNTNNLTYYGSTISSLKERLRCHIKSKKTCSVHKILENNNYQILLVENYECDNKKELLLRERYYIENNNCINSVRNPVILECEKKEYNSAKWRKYADKKGKEWVNERGRKYYWRKKYKNIILNSIINKCH